MALGRKFSSDATPRPTLRAGLLVAAVAGAGVYSTGAGGAGATTDTFGAYWVSTPTVNGNRTLTSASTTFVVPSINCSSGAPLGQRFGLTDESRYLQASQLRIAPFGTVNFAQCQVNGDYLGFGDEPEWFSLHEGDVKGVNIRTGNLTGAENFKLTFVNS